MGGRWRKLARVANEKSSIRHNHPVLWAEDARKKTICDSETEPPQPLSPLASGPVLV